MTIYLDNGTGVTVSRDICDIDGDVYIGASCDVYYNGSSATWQSIYRVTIHGNHPWVGPIYGSLSGSIYACAMNTFCE